MSLIVVKCVRSQRGGVSGKSVRKCEKGEGGLKMAQKKRDLIFEQPLSESLVM